MAEQATTTAQPDTGAEVAQAGAAPAAVSAPADTVLAQAGADPAVQAPAEGAPSAEKDGKDADTPPGAPEAYAEFTFPEGMQADKDLIAEFTPIARELNLPQEKAQALVDLSTKVLQKAEAAQRTAFETQVKAWVDEVKVDPVLGGPNMAQEMKHVARARDQFLDKDTLEFLNNTGLGNHPGLLRALHKIGKAMAEDTVLSGGQGGTSAKSDKEVLYPDQVKK